MKALIPHHVITPRIAVSQEGLILRDIEEHPRPLGMVQSRHATTLHLSWTKSQLSNQNVLLCERVSAFPYPVKISVSQAKMCPLPE